jgi:hypothetical protein
MTKSTVTANEFFFNLGKSDRLTLEASKPLHESYKRGDGAQQKEMRQACMAHYVMGKLAVSRVVADRILSTPRTDRTDREQCAYRVANERFTYHVSRTNNKVANTKVAKSAAASYRIDPKMRDTAMRFLAEFEGESLAEQIKAAKALLSAMG